MRFAILGPLAVLGDGGEPIVLRAGMPRLVLAALLLTPNAVVSTDQLAEVIWTGERPAAGAQSLRNHVLRLRRQLGPGAEARVRTVPPGYMIELFGGELDAQVFTDECANGLDLLKTGEWASAREILSRALSLWRGDPFADGPHSADAGIQIQRLQETRLLAVEGRTEAELNLGRHRELVADIGALAAAHPLRESIHGQLMLALYRAGQQAEALQVFQTLRGTLVEELGVEPGPSLQELHGRILSADRGLQLTATGDEPGAPTLLRNTTVSTTTAGDRGAQHGARYQLPPDTRLFTGRALELQRLLALTREVPGGNDAGMVVISAIDGMGGVGKSALAIHAAHHLRGLFPDGQLFIDLNGHTANLPPLTAEEALDRLLRSLGVPPQTIPPGLGPRASLYRDRLADTRTLIVLDNAGTTAQVRPLLPASPGCLVLVTSRKRLLGLDDAHNLALDTLPPSEAEALLHKAAGLGRIPASHPAIGTLISLCGHLPLAIRITAARLRHRRALRIEDLVEELRDEQRRLDHLQDEDRNLAAVFDASYVALPAAEQQLYRRLGLVPGSDFDAYAAANLIETDRHTAERLLESLLDHNLLIQFTPGRYAFHDLVRLHARAQNGGDSSEQWQGPVARQRLFAYYQQTAQTADEHLALYTRPSQPPRILPPAVVPELPDRAAALAWMSAERNNLLAAVHDSAHPEPGQVVAIAAALAAFLQQDGSWQQAAALHQAAANAAHGLGSRPGEAGALWELARVHLLSGDFAGATELYQRVIALFEALQDRTGEAVAYADLGRVHSETGDYPTAIALLERALGMFQSLGEQQGEANTLKELGSLRFRLGDFTAAAGFNEQARMIFQRLGNRMSEANLLIPLGKIRCALGDYRAADDLLERAVAAFRDFGHRHGEAYALWHLGRVDYATGRYPAAAQRYERTLAIFQELGDRHGVANALLQLGRVRHATGDPEAAGPLLEQALAMFQDVGSRQGEAEALNCQGALLADTTGPREALALHQQALRLARELHHPMDEAMALEGSARCAARLGEHSVAIAELEKALTLYQRMGVVEADKAAAALSILRSGEA